MRASLAVALREYNGRASQYRHVFDAGVRIIFNYSEGLLDVPSDVTVHTSNPAVELLHALYFHLA
jgi:NADH/NAD ratio-sensing transcriptional regulator Rex